MKHDWTKFSVGDWVVFSTVYARHLISNGPMKRIYWRAEEIGQSIGVVTGIGTRRCGRSEYCYDYGWTFTGTITVTGWLVRTGMRNRELLVPDSGIERTDPGKFPMLHVVSEWPDVCRDAMRKEMADWPRDSRGRWTKKALDTASR